MSFGYGINRLWEPQPRQNLAPGSLMGPFSPLRQDRKEIKSNDLLLKHQVLG